MANVVVLGAGLGGTLMVPTNPWVAVGWRTRQEIEIDLESVMRRKRIRLLSQGAERVHPAESRVEMTDGTSVRYD